MASRIDSRTKIEEAKQAILAAIDVRAEYEQIGLRIPPGATVRESGWLQAFALGREDKKASAAIQIDTGVYKDSGDIGRTLSFWDAQVQFGPFRGWFEVLEHFAGQVKVKLPKRPDDTAKDQVEEAGLLNALNCRGFLARYPGVRLEDLQRCGCRLVRYPKRSLEPYYCVAWPFYGPKLTDSPNRGWVIQATDGREMENSRGEREKRLAVGAGSGLANWEDLNHIAQKRAKVVIKVEGFSDMMALLAIRPESKRTSVAIVTNACGASELALPGEVAKVFAGCHLAVIHDADEPGQAGAAKWIGAAQEHAGSVRNVQLYPEIAPKHGKDLRNWIAEGHTWDDLERLIENTPASTQAEKPLTPAEEICRRLNLTIYGIVDAEKRAVLVFDSKGRRQTVIPKALSEYDVRALVGPELCRKHVNLTDDEPDPQRTNVKQIAAAIADLSASRILRDESFHGDGIWRSGDECLTLVQGGMVVDWNGTGRLELSSPFRGDTVYDQSGRKWFDVDDLTIAIGHALKDPSAVAEALDEAVDLFRRWDNWKYRDSAELLGALIPATFLQTIWDARPLVAITGRSNTGKTYLRDAVHGIFGPIGEAIAKSTEAGLRSLIRNTACAVWMDEFEDDKHREPTLKLLRTSLRKDTITRSSPDQKLIRYGLKHIVWASAKELGLVDAADVNRFITFELMPVPIERGSTLEVPPPDELRQLGIRLLVAGLMHWKEAIALTKEIRKVSFAPHERRLVEIYSVPICMAAAIRGNSLATACEQMQASLDQRGGDVVIEHDETVLMHEILTADVRLDTGKTFTVGQLLKSIISNSSGFSSESTIDALERSGIAVKDSNLPSQTRVFFHPKTVSSKLLSKHSSGKDIRLILQRIPGADSEDRCRLNGTQLRGISVPAKAILSWGQAADDNVFGIHRPD